MTKPLAQEAAAFVCAVGVALVGVMTPATAVMTIVAAVVFIAAANRPAWFATRRPAHVAAVALVVEALVVLAGNYASHLTPAVAVGFITVDVVVGMVIVAALAAVAFELKSPIAIAGAIAWLVGWIGVGAVELWSALAAFGLHTTPPHAGVLSSVMFALGGTLIGCCLVRSVHGAERRSIARWCVAFVLVSAYVLVDGVHAGFIGVAVAQLALAAMLKRWHLPPSPVPRAIISTPDSR